MDRKAVYDGSQWSAQRRDRFTSGHTVQIEKLAGRVSSATMPRNPEIIMLCWVKAAVIEND